MDIRNYSRSDAEACLRLFHSNQPTAGQNTFEEFLQSPPGSYYVMENEGELLGCGGFCHSSEPGFARLTWTLIRHDLHRNGLGKFLLFFRLREIAKLPGISMVELETTPQTAGFFEKAGGFRVVGPAGPDRVRMVKKLAVCT